MELLSVNRVWDVQSFLIDHQRLRTNWSESSTYSLCSIATHDEGHYSLCNKWQDKIYSLPSNLIPDPLLVFASRNREPWSMELYHQLNVVQHAVHRPFALLYSALCVQCSHCHFHFLALLIQEEAACRTSQLVMSELAQSRLQSTEQTKLCITQLKLMYSSK